MNPPSATGLPDRHHRDLVYDSGFAAAVGLTPVVVPQLATPLVYDQSRCYLAVRNDAMVEMSRDWHFDRDATSIRVRARVTAAIPDPNKAIRKLSVTTAAQTARPSGKAASTVGLYGP